MDFEKIERLQREVNQLRQHQVAALRHYHVDTFYGFRHTYLGGDPNDFSKASTATCVLSLVATNRWQAADDKERAERPWNGESRQLVRQMLHVRNWESAGLPPRNPFTVAFLLEAVTVLDGVEPGNINRTTDRARLREAVRVLRTAVQGTGGAAIEQYPPSPYVTQLVVRALKRRRALTPAIRERVRSWAWTQVEHEMALLYCGSKSADAYALAYAVMVYEDCLEANEITLEQSQIVAKAVDCVFQSQLTDGSWPRSRPLFHYPRFGNAYCYEYEMLVQLLEQGNLQEHCIKHLEELGKATTRLAETAFSFGPDGLGWASGHHPQLDGPESWSTASGYHFLYLLDRLLAEVIRRKTFEHVGRQYRAPTRPKTRERDFAPGFLDSDLILRGTKHSLRDTLYRHFVRPVVQHIRWIEEGLDLPANVPISAIMFGPPGTSKTQLASLIAEYLGWPLLPIDPSLLVRRGLDQIQAETNFLFSMLASLERVVVLLDEFDEMVRERAEKESEVVSRLLTTAMLPKLILINERRRIVFLVATNHIDIFDFAIRRPGRFDLVVQVMPPKTQAKLQKWPAVKDTLESYGIRLTGRVGEALRDFTFAEFKDLAKRLDGTEDADAAEQVIIDLYDGCTLKQLLPSNDGRTLGNECEEHRRFNRVPSV